MLSGSPARPTHHESVLAFLPAVFRWDLKWLLTTVPYAATIIQSELAQKIKPIYYLCSREIHEPSSRLCLERGSLWFWPFFWGQRKGAINVRVGPEANENMCISSPLWTQAALGAMRRRQESIISRPPALVLYLHTVGSDMVLCQLDIFAPLSAFCCMSHWILSASCFLWTATEKSPSLKKFKRFNWLYHPLEMTDRQWWLSPHWHPTFLGMSFSHWKASYWVVSSQFQNHIYYSYCLYKDSWPSVLPKSFISSYLRNNKLSNLLQLQFQSITVLWWPVKST